MLNKIIGFSINNKLITGLFVLALIVYGVYEVTKLPIESATVYLSSAKDSTVIDYTITDKFGKFDFKLKVG